MNALLKLQQKLQASRGTIPSNLVIKNTTYLDVFNLKWAKGDIAIFDGTIVGVYSGYKGKIEIDGSKLTVVPGFIDAHVHIESSLLTPYQFQKAVLPKGTTSVICDPHELANVLGISGIEYFINASASTVLDLNIMLSSCVPATHMETNGGGILNAKSLLPLRGLKNVLGLAEVMNFPGVIHGDPDMLEKIISFKDMPQDGHAPLLSGFDLSAYCLTGISSCHESSEPQEALEKIKHGMSVWIREGSVAKDLEALLPILNDARSSNIGFCTDDRNPWDIEHEGHIDYMIRKSIQKGIPSELAYRSASWSVAKHYGLHHTKKFGAIAPGFSANIVLLNDVLSCNIHSVFKDGLNIEALFTQKQPTQHTLFSNSVKAHQTHSSQFEGVKGNINAIKILPGKILTDHVVCSSEHSSVAKLSVIERHGNYSKPSNGYVIGFGENFQGAIASSVGHDSHNLIVAGKNTEDMSVAVNALIQCGGGFVVAKDKNVLALLELPLGGLMSSLSAPEVSKVISELKKASQSVGCELDEPFLQLAFLSLPVIPSLKLTDKGLVDVRQFKMIDVRAS